MHISAFIHESPDWLVSSAHYCEGGAQVIGGKPTISVSTLVYMACVSLSCGGLQCIVWLIWDIDKFVVWSSVKSGYIKCAKSGEYTVPRATGNSKL